MKGKMIKIVVSLIALVAVAATVGVSFALWEAEPSEYSYVVKTQSYANIDITDIVVDSGKMIPKSDNASATVIISTFDIDIQDYACKLMFSATSVKFIDKLSSNDWINVPNGIVNIEFTNMDDAIITDKAPPFKIGKHTFKVKVTFIPHMDIIDPIYKDTQFKFNIRIDATAVV